MKKIVTTLVSFILLLLLVGCSDETNEIKNEIELSDIHNQYETGIIGIDYMDAGSFEQALNDGQKVVGKIVKFEVNEYKPDSTLGINCWSGEHLNFISDEELDVSKGDVIVGYVKEEASKTLGSWKISYEVLEVNPDATENLEEIQSVEESETTLETTEVAEEDTTSVEEQTQAQEAQAEKTSSEESTSEEKPTTEESTPVEENKVAYTITDISKTMYVVSTANVRSEPDKDSSKLGTLSVNDEVSVTGQVDNGWYRINYDGGVGFIKGSLLSSEKKVVQNNQSSGATSSDNSAGNASNEDSPKVIVPTTSDTEGDLVWVPQNGGTKYHSKSSCSNMENPIQVTKEHAEANGYTACKRCY